MEGWNPVNLFSRISLVAVVTPTDRPKSDRNRCVLEVFGGVFVLTRCFFDFSVDVRAFVIGLSPTLFFKFGTFNFEFRTLIFEFPTLFFELATLFFKFPTLFFEFRTLFFKYPTLFFGF